MTKNITSNEQQNFDENNLPPHFLTDRKIIFMT